MRDKLLRALGPTGRTRGAANARSKIIIMHNLLLFGEHKMQTKAGGRDSHSGVYLYKPGIDGHVCHLELLN